MSVCAERSVCIALLVAVMLAMPMAAWAGPGGGFVSLVLADFDYEEPDVMEESGELYGVRGEGQLPVDRARLRFDGELLVGGTDYEGQTWGGTPVETETGDRVINFGMRVVGRQEPVAPVIGIGYRYWEQDLRGPGGYRRAHQYVYLPIGMEIGREDTSQFWPPQVRLELRHLLNGHVESDLSDVERSFEDAKNDLDGGFGLKAELVSSFDGAGRPWQLGMFVRYWEIDESDPEVVDLDGQLTEVYEPENETRVVGLRFGIGL